MNVAFPADVPWTWLLLRSTGVVALTALTLSVVLGAVGPVARTPRARLIVVSAHNAAALMGLLLTLFHLLLAVIDPWVDVSAAAVVVPGAAAWEPVAVGLGALAVDLLLVIAVTTWRRATAPVLWRRSHLLTYPAWALSWGHALSAGTDASARPMQILAVASFAAVALSMSARLLVTRSDRGGDPAERSAAVARPVEPIREVAR